MNEIRVNLWLIHSERKADAELYFTALCRGFGDRSELRRVDEAIRSSEICVIERVECLGTYLYLDSLSHREFSLQSEIQGLSARTVDGVAAHVAERECRWCRKGCGVEPSVGGPRVLIKNRQAGVVCEREIDPSVIQLK